MNGKQILQSEHSNGAAAQLEPGLAKSDARRATSVSITRVLAESPNIEVAAPQILQAVGEGLGWAAGRLWTLSPRGDVLSCNATWFEPSITDGDLKAIIEQLHLPSTGELRDAVMQSGDTQWADLGDEVMGSPAPTGRNGMGIGSPC